MTRVPDHGLTGDETEQGKQCDLSIEEAPDHRDRDERDADCRGNSAVQEARIERDKKGCGSDQQHKCVARFPEGFAERGLGLSALFLHFLEGRTFVHLETDIERDQQQTDRSEERNAPAPSLEGVDHFRLADVGADRVEHDLAVSDQLRHRVVGVDVNLREHDHDQRQQ